MPQIPPGSDSDWSQSGISPLDRDNRSRSWDRSNTEIPALAGFGCTGGGKGQGMSVGGEMAIHAAKQIKHRGFVINKHARRWTTARAWEVHDAAFTAWAKVRPYRFDPARYPGGEFITQDPPVASLPSELPRVLWCCWTGDNPLTPNRERGLASLIEQNPELEVRLVTRDTLADWVLPEAPLHPRVRESLAGAPLGLPALLSAAPLRRRLLRHQTDRPRLAAQLRTLGSRADEVGPGLS